MGGIYNSFSCSEDCSVMFVVQLGGRVLSLTKKCPSSVQRPECKGKDLVQEQPLLVEMPSTDFSGNWKVSLLNN